ncbi:MAG: polysaccharide deacetylase family protein [Pseudomonadota bacterium]
MQKFVTLLLILACTASLHALGKSPVNRASHGVILQYHHIAEDTPAITSTRPDQFAAHMAYLARSGFEVWPLERLVEAVRNNQTTPEKVVAITFDDAYINIYENAFPLLRDYGWPFTIFVATSPVGTQPNSFLNWDQLREMKTHGATIANHSHSHTHLLRRLDHESAADWRKRIAADITTAQTRLTAELGETPRYLAYPYGEYNAAILDIVRDLGFTGFGQQSGAVGAGADFAVLPRFPFGGIYNEQTSFETKVNSLPLPVAPVQIDPLLPDGETMPQLSLTFDGQSDLRLDALNCFGPGGTRLRLDWQGNTVTATPAGPVPVARSRYNCTMPTKAGGRFYWFSQMWIRKNPDGSWYPEA